MTGRTSFHFPREAAEQLNVIRSRTMLDSYPNIIRVALHSYDLLLRLAESGCHLAVKLRDGSEVPYSPYTKCGYPGLNAAMAEPVDATGKGVPRNFFFSGEATEHLESIKRRSFVKSNADALRVALTSYKELLLIFEIGDKVMVRDRRGEEEEFNPYRPFPIDEVLARQAGSAKRVRELATS